MAADKRRCVLCKEAAGSNAERCPTCAQLAEAVRLLTEPDEPEPTGLSWDARGGLSLERPGAAELEDPGPPRRARLEHGRG